MSLAHQTADFAQMLQLAPSATTELSCSTTFVFSHQNAQPSVTSLTKMPTNVLLVTMIVTTAQTVSHVTSVQLDFTNSLDIVSTHVLDLILPPPSMEPFQEAKTSSRSLSAKNVNVDVMTAHSTDLAVMPALAQSDSRNSKELASLNALQD